MNAWRVLALLLDYPDDELFAHNDELRAIAATLEPASARAGIEAELERRAASTVADIQREYVDTFDFAKRCTLYLSFHVYGDRRQRGMAMLGLKRAYRAAGLELADGALPDHLPAALEFTSCAPEAGIEVLCGFRPALELVRAALHAEESPYGALLDAVCALLPKATRAELEDARRIAAEGPPEEMVGLEPFAPPEMMPPAACGAAR